MTDIQKAEQLAIDMAKGSGNSYWVVRVIDRYLVVPKPRMPAMSRVELKQVLFPKLGCALEAEFTPKGARLS